MRCPAGSCQLKGVSSVVLSHCSWWSPGGILGSPGGLLVCWWSVGGLSVVSWWSPGGLLVVVAVLFAVVVLVVRVVLVVVNGRLGRHDHRGAFSLVVELCWHYRT